MGNLLQVIKERVNSFNADPQLQGVVMAVQEMNYLLAHIEKVERQRDEAVKTGLEQSMQHLKEIEDSKMNLEQIESNVARMANDITEAVKALKWYGDEGNYFLSDRAPSTPIEKDLGARAITTLKRIKGE